MVSQRDIIQQNEENNQKLTSRIEFIYIGSIGLIILALLREIPDIAQGKVSIEQPLIVPVLIALSIQSLLLYERVIVKLQDSRHVGFISLILPIAFLGLVLFEIIFGGASVLGISLAFISYKAGQLYVLAKNQGIGPNTVSYFSRMFAVFSAATFIFLIVGILIDLGQVGPFTQAAEIPGYDEAVSELKDAPDEALDKDLIKNMLNELRQQYEIAASQLGTFSFVGVGIALGLAFYGLYRFLVIKKLDHDEFIREVRDTYPTLVNIHPSRERIGSSLDVTLRGANLGSTSGITLGRDITVEHLEHVDNSTLSAHLSIAPNAVPGTRDVTVTTTVGESTLPNSFEVIPEGNAHTADFTNHNNRSVSAFLAVFMLLRPFVSSIAGLVTSSVYMALSNSAEAAGGVLVFLCVSLTSGYGFAMNDYADKDKDKFNHPERVIPQGLLAPRIVMWIGLLVGMVSLMLSMLLPLWALFINSVTLILLGVYSYINLRNGLAANTITATGCAFIPLFGMASSGSFSVPISLIAMASFFLILGREVLLDLRDMEFDEEVGKTSVPLVYGTSSTLRYATLLFSLSTICTVGASILWGTLLFTVCVGILCNALIWSSFLNFLRFQTGDSTRTFIQSSQAAFLLFIPGVLL